MNDRTVRRFWAKVEKTEGCWLWTAYRDPAGYGRFRFIRDTNMWLAHRVAWVLKWGDIPDGMCVLHRCDNPACVKVSHLFLGTQTDNIRDMDRKKRRGTTPGEKHGLAKLTTETITELRAAKGKKTLSELSAQFDISMSQISKIQLKHSWKYV